MNVCNNSNFLFLLYMLKIIMNLILIGASVLLMISLMIRCARAVIIDKESDTSHLAKDLSKRIVAAVILFLVPGLVNNVLDLVVVEGSDRLASCFSNANLDYISERREEEKLEKQAKKDEQHMLAQQKLAEEAEANKNKPSGGSYSIGNGGVSQLVGLCQKDARWKDVYFGAGNSGGTIGGSGCGLTSMAVMVASFYDKNMTPNKLLTELRGLGFSISSYTNVQYGLFANSTFLSHYNLEAEQILDTIGMHSATQNEFDKVLNYVQNGYGIIMWVPGHYTVVGPNPTCNNNQIYMYETDINWGNSCGAANECMSVETFYDKWKKNNNGIPAWGGAWAYKSA